MRRRIHLVGAFKSFHDGPIEIESANVWDAIEAATSQLPGFAPNPISGKKVVEALGFRTVDDLKRYDTTTEDIYLMPPVRFGKQGVIQTVIGVVLIVAAILVTPYAPGLGATLFTAGVSMTIGGLMQMLTPQPQLNGKNEAESRSKYLASTQNTVAIGTTIPILYGKFRVGGQVLSLNIQAKGIPAS